MELCRLEQLLHDSTRRQLVQMSIHLGADVRALWAALLPGNCSFSPQFVCRPLFVVLGGGGGCLCVRLAMWYVKTKFWLRPCIIAMWWVIAVLQINTFDHIYYLYIYFHLTTLSVIHVIVVVWCLMAWEICGGKWLWANLTYNPSTCLQELKKKNI